MCSVGSVLAMETAYLPSIPRVREDLKRRKRFKNLGLAMNMNGTYQ